MITKENEEKLMEKIKEKDLSISECARQIGISRQSFEQKLNGEREFKISEVARMCKILNIKVNSEFTSCFF